jgi:hypothetical protein
MILNCCAAARISAITTRFPPRATACLKRSIATGYLRISLLREESYVRVKPALCQLTACALAARQDSVDGGAPTLGRHGCYPKSPCM